MMRRTLKHAARLTAAASIALCAIGAPTALAIPPIVPDLTVTPSVAAPATGTAISFTVTLVPAPNAGTVELYDEGLPMAGCTAVPVVNGVATCTTATSGTAGLHYINAMYSGAGHVRPGQRDPPPARARRDDHGRHGVAEARRPGPEDDSTSRSPTPRARRTPASRPARCGCGNTPTETVDFAVDGAPVAGCQARPVDAETGIATCKTDTAPAAGGAPRRHRFLPRRPTTTYLTASAGTDDFTVTAPDIALSANALDFGSVTVGGAGHAATSRSPTAAPARCTLGAITAGGAVRGHREHLRTPTLDARRELRASRVTFTPTAAGAAAATLTVATRRRRAHASP